MSPVGRGAAAFMPFETLPFNFVGTFDATYGNRANPTMIGIWEMLDRQ